MPRLKRSWVSHEIGSYHIISRTARDTIMFDDYEKDYLFGLLKRFVSGFFVDINAFCIMGTHFHILATGMGRNAEEADENELIQRYRNIYGKNADPPIGSFKSSGELIVDEDGGVERLRFRLGSISRFVQELKQTFSLWYNKRHDRRGYLWNDRFKGIIIERGEAQISCSAYIDLNPVRAGIVDIPEEYRWSSVGMMVREPDTYRNFLNLKFHSYLNNSDLLSKEKESIIESQKNLFDSYRLFVYLSGGIAKADKGKIDKKIVEEVTKSHGKMGIGDCLKYRVRNYSEGIAIGTNGFIADIQRNLGRKFIRPRSFNKNTKIFTTRVIHS